MASPTDRQVSILETQSKTSGFSQSTAEAKALDQVFDDVTASSKRVSAAQIDTVGALGRAQAKYSEVARVAQEVARMEDLVARSRAQNRGTEEQYADILSGVYAKQEAVLQRAASAADKNTAALDRMTAAQRASAQAAEAQASATQAYANSFAGVKAPTDASSLAGRAADIEAYGNALDDLKAKYNPLFAAQRQFTQQVDALDHALKVGAINLSEHGAELDRLKAGYQRSVTAMNQSGAAAASLNKNFGLARHQITNLGFQLNDLVVQIASGGGILIPLIQQGAQVQQILSMAEGGVGGVLTRVGATLGRIGPLGWAAFGAAGLAGAVGVSTIALTAHGAKLAENEAKLAAFSTRSSEVIAVSQRLATTLGVSATGGFQTLADATIRWGQALGIVNVDAWITNFGRLALSQRATAESADAAAAAFAKLASQGTMTVGQLVEFVDQYPQFAQAIANALGVTRDQLKKLDKDIEVSSKTVATAISNQGAAAQANVRPWNQLSASVGTYYDALAKATNERWNAALDQLAQGIFNLIDAWKGAVDWIGKYIDKMLQLAGIKVDTPSVPSGGGGGTAPDSGGRTTYKQMVDAMNKNTAEGARTTANTAEIADNTETAERFFQTTSSRYGKGPEFAENMLSGQTRAGGYQYVGLSLTQQMNKMWGRFGGSIAAVNAQTFGAIERDDSGTPEPIGSFSVSPYERGPYQNFAIEQMIRNGLFSSSSVSSSSSDTTKALDTLADAGTKAAESISPLDLGSLGAPIQTKIDALRGLQETALSRTYRPDPYAQKNPDFFYSGERIFKEQQDKVYQGLQTQITKLEGLQSTLAQLLNVSAAFPSAIVSAMQAAGFGDIAAQIIAAFRSLPGAPASATPPATAVQLSTQGSGTSASSPSVVTPSFYNTGRPSFTG